MKSEDIARRILDLRDNICNSFFFPVDRSKQIIMRDALLSAFELGRKDAYETIMRMHKK